MKILCGDCALRSQNGTQCGLTGQKINPQKDFCSHFKKSLSTKCEICGGYIIDNSNLVLDIDENSNIHEICQSCRASLGTCATCDFKVTCEFETNPSQIPKVITQQFQQGHMVMQTQVRNPKRIKITCENGCVCWENGHCNKENQKCDKYKHNY